MKTSILNLVLELNKKLLEFPLIVRSLENKDPSFLNRLFQWISDIETVMTTYSISEVSEISGIKSQIIAPKFSGDKQTSIKKLQLKTAAEALYDLQSVVLKVTSPYESKLEECRDLIRQLLIFTSQIGSVKYTEDKTFSGFLDEIWSFISTIDQLKAGVIKLKASLPMIDISRLLAEEINLEDF
jgi:hypothetical protein